MLVFSRYFVLLLVILGAAATSASNPLETPSRLRSTPCRGAPLEAKCFWATVPEDRADPDSRTIDLWVVIVPARSGASAEPVLFFPGGPGQATKALMGSSLRSYREALARRDAVYIGQRGTDYPNPLHCRSLSTEATRFFGRLFDAREIGRCYRETVQHSDPNLYGTPQYVEDLADVLDLLNYRRVVLWGGSGGTRTALAFLRAQPDRVVAAALLGVSPLDFAMPLPFAGFVDRAWQRVVDECGAQSSCREAYPNLDASLDRVRRRLEEQSVPVEFQDLAGSSVTAEMSLADFAYALRGMLYGSRTIARLPGLVTRAARTGDLSTFALLHFSRSRSLFGGAVALGVHLSVYCSEDVPWIEPALVDGAVRGTLLGRYLVDEYSAACGEWPVEPVAAAWREPVASDVPVLLVSGYFDPSTPDLAAESVMKRLSNSRHVVVRSAGHDAGFGCLAPSVDRFLAEGSHENLDTECALEPRRFLTP
ncbi:MAG: alpha/beta hydrolase [Acidobacteriota bacterium]